MVDLTLIITLHAEDLLAHPTFVSVVNAAHCAEQEGLSVEVLLVLDSADDPTVAVVERALASGGTLSGLSSALRLDVSEGDPGLARNAGIRHSSGRYVGVIDGDDLMSKHWLLLGARLLQQQTVPTIVHPGLQRVFGTEKGNRAVVGSDDPEFRPDTLVEINWWPSVAMAHREVFERHSYAPTRAQEGVGPEDWHWNIETLAAGIPHLVAPETALFYRLKRVGSVNDAHDAARSLLPPTGMLRSRKVAAIADSNGRYRYGWPGRCLDKAELRTVLRSAVFDVSKSPSLLPSGHVDVADLARRRNLTRRQRRDLRRDRFNAVDYKILNTDVHRLKFADLVGHYLDRGIAEGRRALLNDDELGALMAAGFDPDAYRAIYQDLQRLNAAQATHHFLVYGRVERRRASFGDIERARMDACLSDVLIEDWRELHRIDPAIPAPVPNVLASDWNWLNWRSSGAIAHAYWRCVARLPENIDALVLVPGWSNNECRSRALRSLRALHKSFSGSVALLVLDTDETGDDDEPAHDGLTPIALFEQDRSDLTLSQQEHLLATLIQQIQPRLVHALGSEIAFGAFEIYGRVLRKSSTLIVSVGSLDEGLDGELQSPILGRHPDFFHSATKIFAADQATVDELVRITGADGALFTAEPLDIAQLPARSATSRAQNRATGNA